MDYARLAALKMPIGSGAIERTIRRVVNLRLKGASIYWHKKSAEAVLLVRSYWDFLSEGGQARTVSAVDAEAVGGAELLLLQRFASASRAALAVQSVRAVHWSWHRQRESPIVLQGGTLEAS